MPPTLPSFNPARLRTYVFRLPLFTRCAVLIIIFLWVLSLQLLWDERQTLSLVPDEIGLTGGMYRINTYPLVHIGFFHMLLNTLALAPLLERFEAEHGTLLSLALFAGPLSTLPAGLYLLWEKAIWRANTPVMGASIWVFVLLGIEAMKTYRSNPYFILATFGVPTWSIPLIFIVFTSVLIPGTSLLGHLCAVAVGYLYGLGYLKILAPPEKILRWIEGKLNLLGRLPHYVSIDQKTYGRYGVLPTTSTAILAPSGEDGIPIGLMGSTQRLGP